MKRKTVNQEILLITATALVRKEWSRKDAWGRRASVPGQLEEACLSSLLNELLPGLIEKSSTGKKLLLWQIIQCASFLKIVLCDSSDKVDDTLSINPYLFLPASCNN
jgi:hypothetical protein